MTHYHVPDLTSWSALGHTPEEAVAEVERAKEAWLETAAATGRAIPEPRYEPAAGA